MLRDIFEHLVQRLRLDLFAFEIGRGIVEIKDDAALL
jgi:hypothetical protein